ncbi:MAG: S9 family peptidase [Thermoproteota archaeon]
MKRRFSVADIPRYFEVHEFTVSRNGSSIVYTWNRDGKPDLYLKRLPDCKVERLTDGTESNLQPDFSPDSFRVAYVSDSGGNETFGIHVYEIESHKSNAILCDRYDNNSPLWSPDGRYIAFLSNRGGDNMNIFVLDTVLNSVKQISSGRSPVTSFAWAPNSRFLAYTRDSEEALHESKIWLADLQTKRTKVVLGTEGVAYSISKSCWAPDGSKFVYTTDMNGFPDIAIFDLSTHRSTFLLSSKTEKYDPRWSPTGDHVTYLENIDANIQLKRIGVRSGTIENISPAEGVASDPISTEDGKRIFFLHSGPDEPPDVWMYELGLLHRITDSWPPEHETINFVKPKRTRYRSYDGLEIAAWLYIPKDSGPKPIVVMPHGGPEWQQLNRWDILIQILTGAGYLVVTPDYRGSTGYGRNFLKLSDHDLGGGDLRDVVEAAIYVSKLPFAARDKIAIVGASYGGYIAMMALAKFPKIWSCGVSIVGFFDWKTEYESEREYLRYYDSLKVGTPTGNPKFFYERSPINFVDSIRSPVLILHGENDPRCPVSEAKQILNTLASKGVQNEHEFYPDEGHGFRKLKNRVKAYRKILDFLGKYIGK